MAGKVSDGAGYGLSNPNISHHFLESLPGPSLLCDERDAVRGWNQHALSALGLSVNHLFGRSLPEVFRGAQSEAFAAELKRARTRGMGEVTLPFQVPEGPSPRFTFRLMGLSEGQRNWVIVTATLAYATEEKDGSARALLDQHPYGLLVLHTYRVTYANPVSGRLLGFSDANALTGLPLSALVYDPDRALMGRLLDKVLRQKDPMDRLRLRDSQGEPLDMEICLTLLEGDKHPTIQVVFRPVSRYQGLEQALRKHEERNWMLLGHALRRSEDRTREALQEVLEEQGVTGAGSGPAREVERLRSLLDTLSEGFWEGDAEGRARRLNPAMLSLLGYPRGEVVGRPLTEFLPPEERERVASRLADPGTEEAFQTHLRQRDGREVPVRCRVAALTAPGREDPERALFFTDLSTQQALSERLRRRTQADQTIFDRFPGVFWIARTDLSLSYWNHRLVDDTGWEAEDLAQMNAEALIESANRTTFQEMVRSGAQGDSHSFLETRLTTPRGTTALYHLYPVPLPSGDEEAVTVLGIRVGEAQRQGELENWATQPSGFLYMLRREIARSHRHDNPLSLLVVGVVHFARIRERYGYQSAREVLTACENLIRTHSRATDLVARMEGARFFLLAPETDAQEARQLEAKLKQLIHRHDFDPVAWAQPETGGVTYRKGETPEELILRARQTLATGPNPDNEANDDFGPTAVLDLP